MFPSMRHDYIRRHRIMRRITNVVLVVILSVLAGYFITVQPKKAFSPQKNSGAAQADRR
jgi:succinate dehydrogenase hydrophobic anchor subunit